MEVHMLAQHPDTHQWHNCTLTSDYYGKGFHAVKFPDDHRMFPSSQISELRLRTFWVDDIILTITRKYGKEAILPFLQLLNEVYEERWKHDTQGGDGSVEWLTKLRSGVVEGRL